LKAFERLSDLTSLFKLIRFFNATYPAIKGGIPYNQQKQSEHIASANATLRSTRASQILLIKVVLDIGYKYREITNYQWTLINAIRSVFQLLSSFFSLITLYC